MTPGFGWATILRLGLVQTALGAIVVLMTSTINRVMVVELALPALVPGVLVASHYAVQILRPAWGYGSDVGGRRTPWIVGGMAALAIGAVGAALGTALAASSTPLGLALAAAAFLLVGVGAGAAGTSLLAMLASGVAPNRRAAAASAVWMMMILGFAVSAPLAGHFLDPFSNLRLVSVTAVVAGTAFLVAALAVRGVEGRSAASPERCAERPPFLNALHDAWREPAARRFTIFIFVSMLAYSAQELMIEPFAGFVFGMSPGATTKLAGIQHGGVLAGMIALAVAGSLVGGPVFGSLRVATIAGCVGSALSMAAIAAGGVFSVDANMFVAVVFALGVSNGVFAAAAIASMMGLANAGASANGGTRIGLWGASQAIAFGLGGIFATLLVDVGREFLLTPLAAYSFVFAIDATLFLLSALVAGTISPVAPSRTALRIIPAAISRGRKAYAR